MKWSTATRNASYLQNSYVNRTSKQVLIFLVEGASIGNSVQLAAQSKESDRRGNCVSSGMSAVCGCQECEMELLQSWVGCDLNAARPCTQCERINDSICWALVIPSANESSPERHNARPLGSLKPSISWVCYKLGWRVHWVPKAPSSVALSHQLPPAVCLVSLSWDGSR